MKQEPKVNAALVRFLERFAKPSHAERLAWMFLYRVTLWMFVVCAWLIVIPTTSSVTQWMRTVYAKQALQEEQLRLDTAFLIVQRAMVEAGQPIPEGDTENVEND